MNAKPANLETAAAVPSASERLVDQLANKIGGLGVELADVAGNVQEVASRVSTQSERFGHLQKTAETMVSANHDIASASQAVQSATPPSAKSPNRAPRSTLRSSISPNWSKRSAVSKRDWARSAARWRRLQKCPDRSRRSPSRPICSR
jgi:hypothetical protein